jgi:signal transduction histidine kinase
MRYTLTFCRSIRAPEMLNELTSWITKKRAAWAGYASAIILSGIALGLNSLLHGVTERNLFFLSLATIVISAILAGYGPGLLATLLTAFGLNFFFLGARSSARFESEEDIIRITIFILTGLMMAFLGGALRAALGSAKEAQEEAEQATHARDEFISIVSHELKTPLTALKLQTQLGLRTLARDSGALAIDRASHEKLLRSSSETLNRAERLIDDLLDLSRVTHGKLRIELAPVDAAQVVQTVIDRLSNQLQSRNIQVKSDLQSDILAAWDPIRIEQVVTNLLSNAMKYGGGSLISTTLERHGDFALIVVRDKGPGISPEDQQRLFDRFERAGNVRGIKGLGLGLYITKKIVELHGGRIWVESALGQGAAFFVELPLSLEGYSSLDLHDERKSGASDIPSAKLRPV